jgi:hypothetical protein
MIVGQRQAAQQRGKGPALAIGQRDGSGRGGTVGAGIDADAETLNGSARRGA